MQERGITPQKNPDDPDYESRSLELEDTTYELSTSDAVFGEKELENPQNVDQRRMVPTFPAGLQCGDVSYHTILIRNYSLETSEDVVRPGYMIWATGKKADGEEVKFSYNSGIHSQNIEKSKKAEVLLNAVDNKVAELKMSH